MTHPAHYAKAIVAVAGAGVTAALGLVGPDSPAFIWLTIAAAVLTAAAVYATPNATTTETTPPPGRPAHGVDLLEQ